MEDQGGLFPSHQAEQRAMDRGISPSLAVVSVYEKGEIFLMRVLILEGFLFGLQQGGVDEEEHKNYFAKDLRCLSHK